MTFNYNVYGQLKNGFFTCPVTTKYPLWFYGQRTALKDEIIEVYKKENNPIIISVFYTGMSFKKFINPALSDLNYDQLRRNDVFKRGC